MKNPAVTCTKKIDHYVIFPSLNYYATHKVVANMSFMVMKLSSHLIKLHYSLSIMSQNPL